MISFVLNLWLVFFALAARVVDASDWIDYPNNGEATMTHYDLPKDYIASCGCVGGSTKYPTAALSQMAYGSSAAYGEQCPRESNAETNFQLFA